MGTMNIFEVILSLRKHVPVILIAGIVCALIFSALSGGTVTYTASTNLQYKFASAADGLSPGGASALNVYDITKPSVVKSALRAMGSSASVEQVRGFLKITEVLDTATAEIASAMLIKGEEYVYHATEFKISLTYPESWGYNFGKRFLGTLTEAYDEYFISQYYNRRTSVDFFQNIDVEAYDYLELCSLIDYNLSQAENAMEEMVESDSAFRSLATGYTFAELQSAYQEVRRSYYDAYYANVTQGRLTKDVEQLIKTYRNKIDALKTPLDDSKSASDQAYQMLDKFYEGYGSLYKQAAQTQSTVTGNNSGNITLLDNYSHDSSITTYDKLITEYVNNGVKYKGYQHDIDSYNDLIDGYMLDGVSSAQKTELLEKNEKLLSLMRSQVAQLSAAAQRTLDDYYLDRASNDIQYLLNSSVSANVSGNKKTIIGFAAGIIFAAAAALIYEMFSAYMEKRKNALLVTQGKLLTREQIEGLTGIERTFYEQSKDHFSEFSLKLQPRINAEGEWSMAEAFLYWNSVRRGGEVPPSEFLPVAERLMLTDALTVHTLHLVCETLSRLREKGIECPLSVNCSIMQLSSAAFLDTISAACIEKHVDPGQIMIEVSGESEITDAAMLSSKIQALRLLGFKTAIDRYGDSITSMRVLYDTKIDLLIVSRKYAAVQKDGSLPPFLMRTVGICKELELPVCILGVENQEQMRLLKRLGIDYYQGYQISKLLTEDAFITAYANKRGEKEDP